MQTKITNRRLVTPNLAMLTVKILLEFSGIIITLSLQKQFSESVYREFEFNWTEWKEFPTIL